MVTAKFKVSDIKKFGEGESSYQQVILYPVYSSDKDSPNYSWSKWTPSGELKMTITNPNAYEQFAVGKVFLMTFAEVPE